MRNKYAGRCYRCGKIVKPHDGHIERISKINRKKYPDMLHATGWLFQHADCAIKYRGTNHSIYLIERGKSDTQIIQYSHKENKNMSKKITLKNIRIAYPKIVDKGSYEGEENKKFSSDFIIPKNHPQFAELKKLFDEAKSETKKEHSKKSLEFPQKSQALVPGNKINSDLYGDNDVRLRAKNEIRPVCLHENKTKMTLEEISEKIYSGAYVNVQISFWGSEKLDGIIGANLHAIQKFKDGEQLSGAAPDMDAFDALEDEELDDYSDPDFADDEL